MEEGTIIAAQILDGYYFYRVPVNADGCTSTGPFGGLFMYHRERRRVPPLAYFVSLYHTHAMYASTKGMARLTMLIVLRVNSDDEEL